MDINDNQTSDYSNNQNDISNDFSQNGSRPFSGGEEISTQGYNNYDSQIHNGIIDNEILEKLDMKPGSNNQDIQDKSGQEKLNLEALSSKIKNSDKSKIKKLLDNTFSKDFGKIQNLVKKGLIDSEQGQNLRKQVIKKAFDRVLQDEKVKQALSNKLNQKGNINSLRKNVVSDFNTQNPNFFSTNSRKEVLNYLKSGKIKLSGNDLGKISNMIRGIEYSAVERYLQKALYDKNLKNANDSAKQRLTANAQRTNSGNNFSRIFTREQIGKMSLKQFSKYEPIIMEQLKKGMIK